MSSQFVADSSQLQIGGVVCSPDGTVKFPLTLQTSVPVKERRRFVPLPCELQHNASTRNALADSVVDLFDQGSTYTEGRIKIFTSGGVTLLATILMANPAFDDAANGVAQGLGLPWSDTAAAADGVAARFSAYDRDDTLILTGDVALSGEEINFPTLEVAVNDIVKILSISYTAPP